MDSIHEFGENIDQYGRKELPFTIQKLPGSDRFSLTIDYSYSNQKTATGNGSFLWYRSKINQIMHVSDQRKRGGTILSGDTSCISVENETLILHDDNVTIDSSIANQTQNEVKEEASALKLNNKQQLNKDCMDYIQKNSPLVASSLSFLFDDAKRDEFFKLLSESRCEVDTPPSQQVGDLKSSLCRFIRLYVPLEYMQHLSVEIKLNLITQFLLTNKTDESKIELIIDLANHYACKQEWSLVLELLNSCTQDNEELVDASYLIYHLNGSESGTTITEMNQAEIDINLNLGAGQASATAGGAKTQTGASSNYLNAADDNQNVNTKCSQKDLYNLHDHACICLAYQEAKENEKSYTHLFKMKNFLR